MRLSLEQYLTKIGIEAALRPYETIPYDYFNPDKGLDVMAEVSLSGDGTLVNTEVQVIEHKADGKTTFRQIFQLQLEREATGVYMATSLRYMGEQMAGKRRNWFDGSCRFVKQSIALLKKGTVPDFESIFKTTIDETEGNSTAGGSGGGRSLKGDKAGPAKPGQSGRM